MFRITTMGNQDTPRLFIIGIIGTYAYLTLSHTTSEKTTHLPIVSEQLQGIPSAMHRKEPGAN